MHMHAHPHMCTHMYMIFVLLIKPVYLLVPQCFFHLMCLLLSGSYFLSRTGKPTANLVVYTVLHHSLASVEGEAAKTGRFHQIASQSGHPGSLKNCLKQTNIMRNSNRGRNLMSTLASTCTCTACVTPNTYIHNTHSLRNRKEFPDREGSHMRGIAVGVLQE